MAMNPRMGAQTQRIELPGVRNVIAVASGKGGVGKSTVTLNLAVALAQSGAKVGLLDADIYGPSIPLMTGTKEKPQAGDSKLPPIEKFGLKLMSMGYLVPEDQAVVWRGPMVHGALTQFMTQVDWGELDYLFIDMPPGTGDAQLTISQSAPLSGAIIVTTPQDISLADARRGTIMFRNVNIPILGVIENMAGFECSHCHEVTTIFRSGGGDRIAKEMQVALLGSIPLDPRIAEGGDAGTPTMIANPDTAAAKTFREVARVIAAHLSEQHDKPTAGFKSMSLEWR